MFKPIRPEWHEVLQEKEMYRGNVAFKLKLDASMYKQAGCRGLDTELFYPDRDVFTKDEESMFQRMCVECPVMLQCLEWALVHERYGVWGGTTPSQRQRERRRRGWVVNDPDGKI